LGEKIKGKGRKKTRNRKIKEISNTKKKKKVTSSGNG